ncbi:MAG: ATPase [Acidobacteria bacterium]|nr:MAG: ATPase [Acidobacteriota bacterium]
MSLEIGKILGTQDAQPLDFWIAVDERQIVQLDDVVFVTRELQDGRLVKMFGIIDIIKARHEGARFDSDVFLAEEGVLPLGRSTTAHVAVTRVEPEIFVPPLPGQTVFRAAGVDRDQALFFDAMERKFPLGLSRDGEVVYGNLEFLDGSRGAHINISGISGVATKTSYATFLLYGLFTSGVLEKDVTNTHGIIFNVKGEDLLFLDKLNSKRKDENQNTYAKLGLKPGVFSSLSIYAPVKKQEQVLLPDTGSRQEGVTAYCWTIDEFCRERYLRFLFAEADDESSQLSSLISGVEARLMSDDDAARCETFADLQEHIHQNIVGAVPAAAGTIAAFQRRLNAAGFNAGHLIRGKSQVERPDRHRINWKQRQLTVIDIHNLHDRAKRFVVGVVLRRMFEDKEAAGTARPLVFIVLDELNKYAPREGWSPIKEVLLDISERGRSLGVILIGANSAFRVVGRLDLAEAHRDEYRFLTVASRARAGILKPGSVIVHQPEIPAPLLVQFPFPAWATRVSEVSKVQSVDPFRGF